MNGSQADSALETLDSFEERIQKVEWYLYGSDRAEGGLQHVASQGRDNTIQARLTRLENSLNKLSTLSPVVGNLLKLHSKYPDLFQPSATNVPTSLSTTEQLSIVNSCATLYPTTASRLNAIKDLPIPPAESSASLIALHPRLARVEQLQDSQAQEMAEIRTRSASAIQRWYELGVLGGSECWSEWEGRVLDVEKRVRRQEVHQAKEDKESKAYRPS